MIAFANIIGIFLIIMFPLWSRKEEKSWLRKLDLCAAIFTAGTLAYIDIAYFMRVYPPYHMTMVVIVCLLLVISDGFCIMPYKKRYTKRLYWINAALEIGTVLLGLLYCLFYEDDIKDEFVKYFVLHDW